MSGQRGLERRHERRWRRTAAWAPAAGSLHYSAGTEAAERTGIKGRREESARMSVGTRKSAPLEQSKPGNWPEVRWGTRLDHGEQACQGKGLARDPGGIKISWRLHFQE